MDPPAFLRSLPSGCATKNSAAPRKSPAWPIDEHSTHSVLEQISFCETASEMERGGDGSRGRRPSAACASQCFGEVFFKESSERSIGLKIDLAETSRELRVHRRDLAKDVRASAKISSACRQPAEEGRAGVGLRLLWSSWTAMTSSPNPATPHAFPGKGLGVLDTVSPRTPHLVVGDIRLSWWHNFVNSKLRRLTFHAVERKSC